MNSKDIDKLLKSVFSATPPKPEVPKEEGAEAKEAAPRLDAQFDQLFEKVKHKLPKDLQDSPIIHDYMKALNAAALFLGAFTHLDHSLNPKHNHNSRIKGEHLGKAEMLATAAAKLLGTLKQVSITCENFRPNGMFDIAISKGKEE